MLCGKVGGAIVTSREGRYAPALPSELRRCPLEVSQKDSELVQGRQLLLSVSLIDRVSEVTASSNK